MTVSQDVWPKNLLNWPFLGEVLREPPQKPIRPIISISCHHLGGAFADSPLGTVHWGSSASFPATVAGGKGDLHISTM